MERSILRPPDAQQQNVRPAVNRIEFLYFEDCPGHTQALDMLKDELRKEQTVAEIQMHWVETDQEARQSRFPGSPTIRVNGRDIEESTDPVFGLSCRTYRGPDGKISAVPPRDKLAQALHRISISAPSTDFSRSTVGPTRHG